MHNSISKDAEFLKTLMMIVFLSIGYAFDADLLLNLHTTNRSTKYRRIFLHAFNVNF